MNFTKRLLIFLFPALSFAQYDTNTVGNNPASIYTTGLWIVNNSKSNTTEDSYYLLKNWQSKGYITKDDGEVITVPGLNYDMHSDAFAMKVSRDSIFLFNDKGVKEVHIGTKKFRKYKNIANIKHSYFEVLASSNDIEILKHHSIRRIKGLLNPLTQVTPPDKLVDVKRFFLKKGFRAQETKLKTKQFCQFFDSKSKRIKSYISNNKISLKDEKQLQKILNYHNTL